MKRTVLLVVFCMMMGCLLTGNCLAQDAAAFYKGKTITILIPSSPGGTFDLMSRAMRLPISKSIREPGRSCKTVRLSWHKIRSTRSKPDGLTVILCGHGPKEITAQLFKQEGVNFDWTKFTLLGRIPSSSTAFVVDKKLGWKKPADLQGKAFFAGASSPFFEPLFAEALGWDKMSVIPGMTGSERSLAMRRGEIQGTSAGAAQMASRMQTFWCPSWCRLKDPKGFPGVPAVKDVAIKGKEKWGSLASAWDELLYWSYATPGIPQDRAAFLESALQKTYNDPAFRAEMAKLKHRLIGSFYRWKRIEGN